MSIMNKAGLMGLLRDKGYSGSDTLPQVRTWLGSQGLDTAVVHDSNGDEWDIKELLDDGQALEAEVKRQMDDLERATGTGKHKPIDSRTPLIHKHDVSLAGRGGGNMRLQGYGADDGVSYTWKVVKHLTRSELDAEGFDSQDTGGFGEGDEFTSLRRLGGDENASLVDYYRCVLQAGRGHSKSQDRLERWQFKQQGEAIDSEGGFLAPAFHQATLMASVLDAAPWLGMMTHISINRRRIEIPQLNDRDRSSQEIAGFGLVDYAEAATIATDQFLFGLAGLTLQKTAKLVPVSNELLADGVPAVGTKLNEHMANHVRIKMMEDVIRGDGAGQPLGLINAAGSYSQARNGANLIEYEEDWLAMLTRIEPGLLGKAIVLAHGSTIPELGGFKVTRGTDGIALAGPTSATTEGTTVKMSLPPFGTPVFITEGASQLGTLGDFILWDPSSYLFVESIGGPVIDSSEHLRFATDQLTLRIRHRRAGQPWRGQTLLDARNYEIANTVILAA